MATTISVPLDSWVSVNTLSGVVIGTAMDLQNVGTGWIILQEASAKPSDSSMEGIILTSLFYPNSGRTVTSESGQIWAKATQIASRLAVQEL